MSRTRRAIFLDRDGVLNRAVVREGRPYPPQSLAELELMPGARLVCEAWKRAGFVLIIVTNQPDVARGAQSIEVVNDMNLWLKSELGLDDCRVCPHDDSACCPCRKPEPGLITSAAQQWQINLQESFMLGDRWRDVEAGRRAGCRTVFLDYGYHEKRPADADYITANLSEAAEWILAAPMLTEAGKDNQTYEYALRNEN